MTQSPHGYIHPSTNVEPMNIRYFLILAVMAFSLTSCEKEQVEIKDEVSILGRWQAEGFDNVRYDFTADKRYTIYQQDDETFPTLEAFLTENPDIHGHEWQMADGVLTIDLNFGNFHQSTLDFKCSSKVVDFVNVDDTASVSSYHREGHDMASCN